MDADRSREPDPARDAIVADEAAAWLARLDRGLTVAELRELRRWQESDPRHRPALESLRESWANFDLAQADPALAREAAALERATAGRSRARTAPAWWGLGIAAALALTTGVVVWRSSEPAAPTVIAGPNYQVIESSARRVVFDDGSEAEVRGDSEVRAQYSAAERRVLLVRGEAHFTVRKDAARPFVVSAGDAALKAVGTAFNVRLDRNQVEVLVTQGTVEVAETGPVAATATAAAAAPLVTAGERAVVMRRAEESDAPSVEVSRTSAVEVDRALAWQTKRLVFDRTPLQEAVDAFNRHSSVQAGATLVLGDDSLRDRLLGGTFRAANAEAFVRLLEKSVEVRSERHGDRIVLYPAR